jgi:hypothetical protein
VVETGWTRTKSGVSCGDLINGATSKVIRAYKLGGYNDNENKMRLPFAFYFLAVQSTRLLQPKRLSQA